jgi:hypothetical protein
LVFLPFFKYFHDGIYDQALKPNESLIIKNFNLSEAINLFSSKQFLSEYVELIDKANLTAEMKLYEDWMLFNLNIINK